MAMPDDLPPAAEAFLGHYCQEVFSEAVPAMRADLAALLETVRDAGRRQGLLEAAAVLDHGREALPRVPGTIMMIGTLDGAAEVLRERADRGGDEV